MEKEDINIDDIFKQFQEIHKKLLEKFFTGKLNQKDLILLLSLLATSKIDYEELKICHRDNLVVIILVDKTDNKILYNLNCCISNKELDISGYENYSIDGMDFNVFKRKFRHYLCNICSNDNISCENIIEYMFEWDIKEELQLSYESPIEEKLGKLILEELEDILFIDSQKEILNGKYRVDFLLASYYKKRQPLIIECDGHDFHEKTKEQSKRDKQRDRDCLLAGYNVMRFTGSEIYNNTEKCIQEIKEYLPEYFSRNEAAYVNT